jgi:hypothetical protein
MSYKSSSKTGAKSLSPKAAKASSQRSPKDIQYLPNDLWDKIGNDLSYRDLQKMRLVVKQQKKIADRILSEKGDFVFSLDEYYDFIDYICKYCTIDQLTLAHKDLLTFYMVDRSSGILFKKLGVFGKKYRQAEARFYTSINDPLTEAQERVNFAKYELSHKSNIDEYNKSWVVSWLGDMTNNFHFLIEYIEFAIDRPVKFVKSSEKKQPRRQTVETLKTLQTFKNGISKLVKSKPQKLIGEYMELLLNLPLYERVLIGINEDMENVDFDNFAFDLPYHQLFCYRMEYGKFNGGPPAYTIVP